MSAPKGKGKQTVVKTATEIDIVLPVERDFVPGKISFKEWECLLEVDEGIVTVCEVVDEIVKRASDVIYAKYLEDAAYGYAVQDAKENILRSIAMEFVGRDEGEKNADTDPTWMEEEEPQPPSIDSRSCGMIPLVMMEFLMPPVESLSPVSIVQQDIPRSVEFRRSVDKEAQAKRSTTTRSTATRSTATRSTGSESSRGASMKQKASRSRRPKASVHRMVVLDTPPGEEEEKEESRQDSHKVDEPSPEPDMGAVSHTPFGLKPVQLKWMTEVKYDDNGKIVDMVKLDPTKFPSHRTKPIVSVTKPHISSYRRRRQANLKPLPPQKALLLPKPHPPKAASSSSSSSLPERLEGTNETFFIKASSPSSTRTNQVIKVKYSDIRHPMQDSKVRGHKDAQPSCSREARRVTVMPSGKGLSSEVTARRFPEMPTVPALVDSIDPLPGVTVREGGRSVHGPTPTFRVPVTPMEGLRPIRSPPQITTSENDNETEAESAMASRNNGVGFAVSESSPRYENRLLPARVTS